MEACEADARRGDVGGEWSGDVPGERERGESERRKRDVAARLRVLVADESSSNDERGDEDAEESLGEDGARTEKAGWSLGSDACRLGSIGASVEGREGREGFAIVADRERSADRQGCLRVADCAALDAVEVESVLRDSSVGEADAGEPFFEWEGVRFGRRPRVRTASPLTTTPAPCPP